MNGKKKILVIDDEVDFCEAVHDLLSPMFEVVVANGGDEGLRIVTEEPPPDVILVDAAMPMMNGFSVCEHLRNIEKTFGTVVIMLSGGSNIEQRIQAFNSGADDFIAKPFEVTELVARINAKIRRLIARRKHSEILQCGNLRLNINRFEASVNEVVIPLSVLEFTLLSYFVRNKDRVLSRKEILSKLWSGTTVSERNVDTHMTGLRKRLFGFDYEFASVYRAGYMLRAAGRAEEYN